MTTLRKFLTLFIAAQFLFFLGPQSVAADLQDDLSHGYSLIDQWRINEADKYAASLLKQYGPSGDVIFSGAE